MKQQYAFSSRKFDISGATTQLERFYHLFTSSVYKNVTKRLLDVLLAAILLPLLLPLIAVVAFLVSRDGGSAFFVQNRLGKDGKVFKLCKLRTMRVDAEKVLQEMCDKDPELAAEWHKNQKLKNDPRITRIGNFLRKTSLDELPQLWNVIKGDMSFVGPRPMLPSQEELYRAGGGGEGYFSMLPGITGPWQIDGRGTTSFLDRVRYDNFYPTVISLRTDLLYILKTVGVVFKRTGA